MLAGHVGRQQDVHIAVCTLLGTSASVLLLLPELLAIPGCIGLASPQLGLCGAGAFVTKERSVTTSISCPQSTMNSC